MAVDTSVTESGEHVEIVQPVELPEGWDPAFLGSGMLSSPGPTPKYRRAAFPSQAPGRIDSSTQFYVNSMEADLEASPAADRAARRLSDLAGELARTQAADGSYGEDVKRTAAALIALVLLGNTRRKGVRRRAVRKAAKWLGGNRDDPNAALALEVLETAEAGRGPEEMILLSGDEFQRLFAAGEEGKTLAQVVQR